MPRKQTSQPQKRHLRASREVRRAIIAKLNNFAINCAEWRRLSGGRPNVKQAEDGSGAERRNGAATSEVRNAQWDMLRREAHGGIIQRDGLTDGHTGTEVPR